MEQEMHEIKGVLAMLQERELKEQKKDEISRMIEASREYERREQDSREQEKREQERR
jgi:hypothetical protein